MKKAVCLFSGGLDSTTALYEALRQGYEVTALTVDYGQRHEREIESAREIAQSLRIKHHIINVPLPWGGSALTDSKIQIPKGRSLETMQNEIPATYVPVRNTLFLALATSLAETLSAEAIFIWANAIDYSGYPDCRPEFLKSFETVVRQGTKMGQEGRAIRIEAPLLTMNKKDIVNLGQRLSVPFEKTWSCYQGGLKPCGQCDSCLLREKGFQEAGVTDPLTHHEISGHRDKR